MQLPTHWALFLASAFAINLAPGPDLIFILSSTLRSGRKAGFAASVGVCTGALVHVVAAAAGVAALLATSDSAFKALRWLGAAYLAGLGGAALLAAREASWRMESAAPAARSSWAIFRQGMLIDVLNPKVSLFFLAFLPQFVRPAPPDPRWQVLWLGMVVVGLALVIEAALVLAIVAARRHLVRPGVARLLDTAAGLVLLVLAVQLAN